MRGENRCFCCGDPESTSGCVRGFRCSCDATPECRICTKCTSHHHKNCTEGVRAKAEQLRAAYDSAIIKLRDENRINIFDYGEKKELTGWYRTTPSGDVIDW